MFEHIVKETPAAYAVVVTYDWRNVQPTSEFVGMYQSKANADKAHLAAVQSAKENEFGGTEPTFEESDDVTSGFYAQTRVDYGNWTGEYGFMVQTIPLYASSDKWLIDEGFIPA